MNNSKLLEVLRNLSTRAQHRFSEYVHAPFFNKHKPTILLLDFLMQYAPVFDLSSVGKEQVFYAIYPHKKFSDTQFNYVVSKLLELLSGFLAYQEYETQAFQQKSNALKAVHELGVPKQAASHSRQHQLLQKQYPFQTVDFYYQKYHYHTLLNQIHLDKKQRLYDVHLQEQNNQLDYFYIAQKLKIACDMLSRNIVIQANYEAHYIKDLLSWLEAADFDKKQHPLIHVYYQVLKTLQNSDDKAYQQLKVLIEDYGKLFLREELILLYDYAENFCIRKINNGITSYYKEFLTIYKQKLEKHLLLEDGYLPESDYKNIVTAGVRTKDYQWTEIFIHKNKKKLRPEVQENAFNYNLAVFYYATQQYSKALKLLMTILFTDISYGVGAKTIQLQIYYELQEMEPLINLVDTFRLYVMRHKTQSDYRKKANLNMLRIVKKVAKLKEKSTFMAEKQFEKERTKLQLLYAELSPLSNSDWIKEIIEELAQNASKY
ncbi:hypothetical protein [Aureispira sp. CCB-E]|uniref:hypothetical protein n=1 Tax=Aureispira sp. CCB-E TaxID=3051121 RepID=UPI00286840A6|nr:hypothetical protein [Aureispira sp. CCB-E]WMX14278.1 hypothetical protein QP953_25830 [Aureispira sp. CCB-E]